MTSNLSQQAEGRLRIGVDLDNTIVCYDRLFQELAIAKNLAPPEAPASKLWIREHLRTSGREDAWTELQGEAYGAMMHRADMFPGVQSFFAGGQRAGHTLFIISHRTRHPYLGPRYDLHEAAQTWLADHDLSMCDVYLEPTRAAKLDRIAELQCTHFIDDLFDFLTEPAFCEKTQRILFDPQREHEDHPDVQRTNSWQAISQRFGLFDPSGSQAQ